jgi:hypothetical protein
MAQKGAWAVKQMQLEAELASSGMQQGMQVCATPITSRRGSLAASVPGLVLTPDFGSGCRLLPHRSAKNGRKLLSNHSSLFRCRP